MIKKLPTDYQNYIHQSRYARYNDVLGRRETWEETVTRYCDFFKLKFPTFPYAEAHAAILNLEVMPSMRALMTAGPALERDNLAGYNCSYIALDNVRAFDEAMFVLMCGTGLGFSVERQFINQLPEVAKIFTNDKERIIRVRDSKAGWATGFRELIASLYEGRVPSWDFSSVRPAGARLKTFGGRASGAEPLGRLFEFTVKLFQEAAGRKLNSVECHDLVCKIAEVVVVGGVRRSALISLSNLTDERMRNAKSGQWWEANPQRGLANNSVSYTEKPDMDIFMREWHSLYTSKSGERGVYNRVAAKKKAEEIGRDPNHEFGLNPCAEISLRSAGLCNLTEAILRPTDSLEDMARKVALASIIGTYQSALTNFRYVRPIWKKNAEEERLLGVSLTGILDSPLKNNFVGYNDVLRGLRKVAQKFNIKTAAEIGINPSVAITTVKPSGTVSQLVDSASGIHPRYAAYYERRVRNDIKDPLTQFLIDQGVPYEQDKINPNTVVFCFPQKSPEGSITRNEIGAIGQLEQYLQFKQHYTDHNVSITVYVKEHEWLEVGAWVYKYFDDIGGVSFLPHSDHTYQQAPYTEINQEQYDKAVAKMPVLDWSKLGEYENGTDNTLGSQELACAGGACEIL